MGTRFYLVLIVVAASLVLATGCRNRSRSGGPRPGVDSGTISVDAGPTPMTDSGMIVLMDSGMVRVDSGPTPECLSNSDCLSSQMCSGGRCVPRTTSCRVNTVPLWTGPRCASSTLTCIEGCPDNACAQSCLDSDPDPTNCNGCIQNNSIYCYNNMGCQTQWNCFWQCVEDNSCADRACVTTYCGPEDSAYSACADTVESCGSEIRACFP